jgi:hypothetical protein
MVYAFPFRPVPLCSIILLLPLFVDDIIISINWNCLVIFVIVSFIIDLLDLHFHIFGGRGGRDRFFQCQTSCFHYVYKVSVVTMKNSIVNITGTTKVNVLMTLI